MSWDWEAFSCSSTFSSYRPSIKLTVVRRRKTENGGKVSKKKRTHGTKCERTKKKRKHNRIKFMSWIPSRTVGRKLKLVAKGSDPLSEKVGNKGVAAAPIAAAAVASRLAKYRQSLALEGLKREKSRNGGTALAGACSTITSLPPSTNCYDNNWHHPNCLRCRCRSKIAFTLVKIQWRYRQKSYHQDPI